MNEMRAVQYDSYGPPEVLQLRTVPVPGSAPGTCCHTGRGAGHPRAGGR